MYHLALVKAQEYDESENSMVLLRDSITIIERDVDQYDLRNPSIAGDLCEQIDQTIDGLAADAVFDAETPPDDGSLTGDGWNAPDVEIMDEIAADTLAEQERAADLLAMAAEAYADYDAEQSIIDETLNRR